MSHTLAHNPPSSAYTPLESLLLFQALRNGKTIDASSFSRISDELKKVPLVRNDPCYDSGRLSPDALRDLYLWLLKDEVKIDHGWRDDAAAAAAAAAAADDVTHVNGDANDTAGSRKRKAPSPSLPTVSEAAKHAHLLPRLVTRLYTRYRENLLRKIREQESRHDGLVREVGEIEAGKWDERFRSQQQRELETQSQFQSQSQSQPTPPPASQVQAQPEAQPLPQVQQNSQSQAQSQLQPLPRALPHPQPPPQLQPQPEPQQPPQPQSLPLPLGRPPLQSPAQPQPQLRQQQQPQPQVQQDQTSAPITPKTVDQPSTQPLPTHKPDATHQPVVESTASSPAPASPQTVGLPADQLQQPKRYSQAKIDAIVNHPSDQPANRPSSAGSQQQQAPPQQQQQQHRRTSSNTTLPPLSEIAPNSPRFGGPTSKFPTPQAPGSSHGYHHPSPTTSQSSPFLSQHPGPPIHSPQLPNTISRPSSSPRPILPPPPGVNYTPSTPQSHGSSQSHGPPQPALQPGRPLPPQHTQPYSPQQFPVQRQVAGISPAPDRQASSYQQPHVPPQPVYYQQLQGPYADRRTSFPRQPVAPLTSQGYVHQTPPPNVPAQSPGYMMSPLRMGHQEIRPLQHAPQVVPNASQYHQQPPQTLPKAPQQLPQQVQQKPHSLHQPTTPIPLPQHQPQRTLCGIDHSQHRHACLLSVPLCFRRHWIPLYQAHLHSRAPSLSHFLQQHLRLWIRDPEIQVWE